MKRLVLLILPLCLAAQTEFDLLLKGGHVIDGKNNLSAVRDVAIANGKVALIDTNIDSARALKTVNATGLYVTPGLIDIHAHVYTETGERGSYAGDLSIPPDGFTFRVGVTTVADAGSSGWRNFEDFKDRIIDRSRTRVLAFLNIVGNGMRGGKYEQDLSDMNAKPTADMALKYKGLIVGVKSAHFAGPEWKPYEQAVEAGKTAGIPVMIDYGANRPERPLYDLLTRVLRPGDIYTHMYSGLRGEQDESGGPSQALLEGRKRGIIFDVGHGGGSFLWRVAAPLVKAGFIPDSISTDIHTGSMNASMKDMLNVMDKMLALGLPLDSVILRSTWNPAKEIGHPELGNLSVGSPADVAVLRVEKGNFGFVDMYGAKLDGTQKLDCELTIRNGRVVFDLNGLTRETWTKLPANYRAQGDPHWDGFSRQTGGGLAGTWVTSITLPNGDKRDTTFAFIARGSSLTGYLSNPQGDVPIVDGLMSGSEFSFATIRYQGVDERKISYKGRITPEGIAVTMPGFGGGPGREVMARRISSEQPKPMPPAPPRILLPPAEPLPFNGLAKTPPMGWNSWNKFQGKVNDQVVREIADAMVRNGMRDAGYVYVNIDDTWEAGRDAQGNILTNEKFPDMKALADYVHAKGLKLGIYSSPGPKTCAGFEGSFQHEEQDAKTYAAWGIDYLKYDWCSAARVYQPASMQPAYAKMGRALAATGRSIVYSLCQYGLLDVGEWGAKVGGNLWRTTGDIRDTWASMSAIGFDQQSGREKYAGPGRWNDPDMLEAGNGGMTDTEYRTHMSLWALLAAPLLAGNDLRSVPSDTLAILTNKEVIAVDQDPLGAQARRVSKDGDLEVWARKLQDGGMAVGLFNRGPNAARVVARFADLGLTGKYLVRDLWAHADRGDLADHFAAEVPSHGVNLIKLGH